MGPQSLVEAYPMQLYMSDLPIVASMVLLIGFLAIVFPAYRAGDQTVGSVKLS